MHDMQSSRKELIAICKEKGLKGYNKKKKDELLLLLETSTPLINKSPLRYPGGKSRGIPILYEYICKYYNNRKTLISPFFGGGSFELFLITKGYSVYANDLFKPLYTFWVTKQTCCRELVEKIKEVMLISKEKFYQLRNSIMHIEDEDEMQVAASYFLINRTSFSGATLSGGYSEQAAKGRLTDTSIDKLVACNVENVVFSNMDCNAFLEMYPETDDTVVYADPPYFIDKYIYGKNGDMHNNFDHISFAKTIQKRKDWMVSYNDCAYIRELYKGCMIFEVNCSYGMNKSKLSSEIIIIPTPVS